ncbi:spermatogenesis-associated protein 46 [Mesoplodon densirostris]|uniref:spermatogenesis-associated protein 46 n=1 Tax=Mesoplodon densirostris TaxID=48708 RepID=UPI0028DC6142|nr:spermatogenesis-associated protein 46 [Mesoplodon densirostris]
MFIVRTTQAASREQVCVTSTHFSSQNMENFSLFSISGPRISSSAMGTFPDITSSRATCLPGIAKTVFPTEVSSPAQALLPQYQSRALWHGVHNTGLSPDCILGDPPNGEQLRWNCTIYRPWFSPYSYFVRKGRESHLETYSFPEVQWDEGRRDNCLPEDTADSICSSSSSPENTCPREATKKSRHSLDSIDHITSQDILMASKGHPAQQNGYKCVACCRMYPTMHSLKSHIKWGFKEGFSCKVYYRKLKTLWGKEQKARPGDRLSSGSCQAFK